MVPKRRRYRFKLLLDENFPSRKKLVRLNNRYDVKHISEDVRLFGISDAKVCAYAQKEHRILVTFNVKHFKNQQFITSSFGIVGVSTNLSNDQIDKKLSAFFSKITPNILRGRYHYISREA